MGRPKTIENRELLAIALRVFRQHGHTATTRDVARAAGISEAVLYQRFKTKDDLFFAALAPHVPVLSALFDIDASAHAPRAYLAVFAAKAKDHFRNAIPSILRLATHPKYSKDLLFQIHQHNRAGEVAAMLNMRLVTWQQAGLIRRTNPRDFSGAFLHALHSMAMIDVFTGDTRKPTRVAEMRPFVDIFWDGLEPGKSAATKARPRSASRKTRAR